MEYLSIDRIEGMIAVCEDDNRKKREIRLAEIDGSPKEGDIILYEDGRYRVSEEETNRRREQILLLQKRLFGDDK